MQLTSGVEDWKRVSRHEVVTLNNSFAEEFFCHRPNTCIVTLVDIHSYYLRNGLFQALWHFFSDRVVNVWNALPAADVYRLHIFG